MIKQTQVMLAEFMKQTGKTQSQIAKETRDRKSVV